MGWHWLFVLFLFLFFFFTGFSEFGYWKKKKKEEEEKVAPVTDMGPTNSVKNIE